MRLQTFLAHAGIASRRSSEAMINSGRVSVNGRVVRQRGYLVDPGKDRVEFDGKEVGREGKEYYVLNKPKGVVSTVKDSHASRIVIDLLPLNSSRLYPVGRLDKDTQGLILLTNDGALTYRLTHPRFGVEKVYRVVVTGDLKDVSIVKLTRGLELSDGMTAPCRIRLLSRREGRTECEISISEGRKRQIRRAFSLLGHDVIELKRISLGPLKLGNLKEGAFRRLTKDEVSSLMRSSRCS